MAFRVGLKLLVTGKGAAVGLNGGLVHTVQLGANCLPGTECLAWNETNAAITAEGHRETEWQEQESAGGSHPGETPGIIKSCRVSPPLT